MGRNLKNLFFGILIFGSIGFGVNFLDANFSQSPRATTAQISPTHFRPTLKAEADKLEINAEAGIALFLDNNGETRVLFDKNAETPLPIASLTKLMGAVVIAENYSLDKTIEITGEAADKPGNGSGQLKTGDKFLMSDLFKVMLVESNNSAAMALSQIKGTDVFVGLMNQKANDLNLESMNFINPTGLDMLNTTAINQSSARDLAQLAAFILQNKTYIFEISLLKEFALRDINGALNHTAENTNALLEKIPLMVGGKTGETPKSGGCLLLVVQAPKSRGYLISVVLDSPDRFAEMEKIINWTRSSYQW
ncbi:MAG: D-alanyl-D-alanine carboxypeptidase [Candidatus Nealsonbacteria bacterium]|nr:D-alanyl-D-alanine carboxypeptidase [Candidatus Nealsonbacteria bacterium]